MANAITLQYRGVHANRGAVPSTQLIATNAAINPNRLLELNAGEVLQATANSLGVIGASGDYSWAANSQVDVLTGYCNLVADLPVTSGQSIKASAAGRAVPLVTSALAGTAVETTTAGGAFTNQPANDGVEMVSDGAGDTSTAVTIYYTRNALGDTVYTDSKTTNGVTQVVFTDTDIALVLGVFCIGAHAGTITIREASANATITTLAAGVQTAGFDTVTNGYLYNIKPTIVADGASTKVVGLIGTDENGATIIDSQPLNGTTAVTMNEEFRSITFVLKGDVEVGVLVTVKVGAADDASIKAGKAITTQATIGDTFFAYVSP